MGRFHISQVNPISGPWLLSHESLETLNDLFNTVDQKLSEALSKTIETTARQQMEEDGQGVELSKRIAKLQRKFSSRSKSAVVTFSDGSTFEGKDVEEVVNHVNGNNSLTPIELYIRTLHGNHENEFNLVIDADAGTDEPDFEYRIKCLDYDIQLEIKTCIDRWIRANKPSRLLQFWSNGFVGLIWFVSIITLLITGANLEYTETKNIDHKQELKEKAKQIIEDKSHFQNTDSVLLLLLKLETNYVPPGIKPETILVHDKGMSKWFISSLLIFCFSIIRPRTVIGIGRKYAWYKVYKFWWTFIICGGISLLATTLIADGILHFINW